MSVAIFLIALEIDHMNILFMIKVKILMFVKWSYRSPLITQTMEPRMNKIFWAHNPISFKHISVWCPFWDLHLTTHHSNVGAHILEVLE